ncbi:hypothetical protein DR64_4629 [Paraburkholderia xenovorans LB400]|nr:hypothetical protein DR64_4629 [Paraburkholderia xenovorans LB400]
MLVMLAAPRVVVLKVGTGDRVGSSGLHPGMVMMLRH